MGIQNLSLIATIVPLIIVAIGLVGLVLSLRSDVTTAVKQQVVLEEKTESLETRFSQLEEQLAIADNEMRTIMADHSGFNEVLKELGKCCPRVLKRKSEKIGRVY